MTRLLLAYGGALATFCALDFAWLGLFAKGFYQSQLSALLLPRPNWTAAALFYLAYPAGVVLFAITPALDSGGIVRVLALGAILGTFAYATYDLTNLATLKGWSAGVTVLDIAWGALVTAAAAAGGFLLARLAAPGA
jgi:uncharacterized membrane protein